MSMFGATLNRKQIDALDGYFTNHPEKWQSSMPLKDFISSAHFYRVTFPISVVCVATGGGIVIAFFWMMCYQGFKKECSAAGINHDKVRRFADLLLKSPIPAQFPG